MVMKNDDIIRIIGKISFYIYARLQITKAAIQNCWDKCSKTVGKLFEKYLQRSSLLVKMKAVDMQFY